MPESTQLPSGVNIPVLSEAGLVATVALQPVRTTPGTYSLHRNQLVALPCTQVPLVAWQGLATRLQLSLAQAITDPVTCNPQWHQLLGEAGIPILLQPGVHQPAAVMLVAPQARVVTQALERAMAGRPALLVAHLPADSALSVSWESAMVKWQQHGRAVIVTTPQGYWLVLAGGPAGIKAWLRPLTPSF
jgi:hypothetical protein